MSSKTRIAILEDQQIAVDCYACRLQGAPAFEIVGVANVYSDWEALLATRPPDMALMEVKVPTASDRPDPYPSCACASCPSSFGGTAFVHGG